MAGKTEGAPNNLPAIANFGNRAMTPATFRNSSAGDRPSGNRLFLTETGKVRTLLHDHIRTRHQSIYLSPSSQHGTLIRTLIEILKPFDILLGWPHRTFLYVFLRSFLSSARERGRKAVLLSELLEVELSAIDIWTMSWPVFHLLLIYPLIYTVSSSASLWHSHAVSLIVILALWSLSAYRYLDIMTTLMRLHLPANYTPIHTGRAVTGTLLQILDITTAFASTYLLLSALVGQHAFGGEQEITSTLVTPLYFSLGALTTGALGDIYAATWPSQAVVAVETLTGIFLLVVILQRVVSPMDSSPKMTIRHRSQVSEDHTWGDLMSIYRGGLYQALLDRFRHPEPFVQELFKRYVEVFRNRSPVIDIGCGRGEFLQVMAAARVDAYGVEINPLLVESCRVKNLKVILDDWKTHLTNLSGESLGGVFCAQFVEHLGPNDLIDLFSIAYQKLRRGGCLVVETLTPCLNTMIKKFYVDFTHRVPLSPDALSFVATYVGFSDVRVDHYNPPAVDEVLESVPKGLASEDLTDLLNRNLKRLDDLIFLPHYYSVTAVK